MQYFAILELFLINTTYSFLTTKTTISTIYPNNNIRLLFKRSFYSSSSSSSFNSSRKGNNPLFIVNRQYRPGHHRPSDKTNLFSSTGSSSTTDIIVNSTITDKLNTFEMTLPPQSASSLDENMIHTNGNHTIKSTILPKDEQDEVIEQKEQSLIKAKIVKNTNDILTQCANERIKQNKLVSFPTETVYGLGANGLSPTAIEKIYKAKGRPKTSPLILHVLSVNDALKLWNITDTKEYDVLLGLCNAFFPGPLTIISKANLTIVPNVVTANTGYVAVRAPNHTIARQLLECCDGIPIAAPSANKFGHVSPTKSHHVYNDLQYEDVWIIDEDDDDDKKIGVESTVAKVDFDNKSISILRHGAISAYDIYTCLETLQLHDVYTIQNMVQTTTESKDKNHVSPGQTIRHYAPNIPCFIVSHSTTTTEITQHQINILNKSIIIDYNQTLLKYKKYALYYKDLSCDGNIQHATSNLFDTLRWAENVDTVVKKIYVPEIVICDDDSVKNDKDSLILALKDRLTRAASGQIVDRIE